jgi:hypothetical protein
MLSLVPQIVWLHEFRKFEKKPVINVAEQTIDVDLVRMLWTFCNTHERLVVGSPAYKDLIIKLLVCISYLSRALCPSSLGIYACVHSTDHLFLFQGLNCHYEEAVNEVMWGLQNLMHTLVPQEQSVRTKDDLLPTSLGLNMVLNRYEINVEKEMVSLVLVRLFSDMRYFLFYHDLSTLLPVMKLLFIETVLS